MNPIGLIKFAADIVVSAGVGAVVGNAVKATSPLTMKLPTQILVGIGSAALSGMAGSKASNYVSEQIDTTTDQLKELKTSFRKKKN